jgi:hypothetical protein
MQLAVKIEPNQFCTLVVDGNVVMKFDPGSSVQVELHDSSLFNTIIVPDKTPVKLPEEIELESINNALLSKFEEVLDRMVNARTITVSQETQQAIDRRHELLQCLK